MLKNITLGQYYPIDSPVHRLDPRVKILLTIVLITGVFMCGSFIGYALSFLFILFCAKCACVPTQMLLKGLKPLRVIVLLTFFLNLFFTQEGTVLLQLSFVRITSEGLKIGAFYAIRLLLLVMSTSIMTLTTSPVSLADGIELLLSPLKVFHFPAHELAMIMTIALRFIPLLLEETDKIMKAQMARGADFESGNLIARAKAMVPLLVPLFVSAFRRASELAMAMESRCYHGGTQRTRLRVLKITQGDIIACAVTLLYLALILVERTL